MLDIMRRKKRLKIILWLVIFSLALGMLLFFVPGVNMGSVTTDTSAASVDGEAIPMQEFAENYRRVVNNYTKNQKVDPETLRAMGLPKQVLDGMITEKVMEVTAKRLGLDVTTEEVRQAIQAYPYFQDQGKFIGLEGYKSVLNANGVTVTEFERDIRNSEMSRKLRQIVSDALNVSDRELRDEFARSNQQTVADYVFLKKSDYEKRVKPTEAELQAYFNEHKDAYRIKEKRRAQYLLVPTGPIIPGIKVTDQEIRAEWDQRPHEETVESAHILFKVSDSSKEAEVKAKAESVLKLAKSNADFAGLAKKYSEDPGTAAKGGELGPVQRGQGLVKEFEDAIFSMKAGEISLAKTEFGFHIIKVMKHEKPTLEAARPALIAAIQQKRAQEIARQKAEQVATNALKTKDLAAAAKDLGVAEEINETKAFKKDDSSFEFGISQALQNEVFELKEIGSVGKAVEHPLGFAVSKLIEVQMPKAGDFASSRAQVEKDYADFKAKELVQAEAKKLSEEAGKQGSLEKAAKQMGLTTKTSQPFNISGTPNPEIGTNSAFNQTAFDLAPGAVSSPLVLLDNQVVLQVKSRTPFDEAAFEKQRSELRDKALQANQEPYFQDYVRKLTEDLEKAGKIRRNQKALQNPNSY
jgi:peptidyl-prolyl cis-trans isomerase D